MDGHRKLGVERHNIKIMYLPGLHVPVTEYVRVAPLSSYPRGSFDRTEQGATTIDWCAANRQLCSEEAYREVICLAGGS
jgi:hypothetical protein